MPDYRQVVFNRLCWDMKIFLDAVAWHVITDRRLSAMVRELKTSLMFARTQLED